MYSQRGGDKSTTLVYSEALAREARRGRDLPTVASFERSSSPIANTAPSSASGA